MNERQTEQIGIEPTEGPYVERRRFLGSATSNPTGRLLARALSITTRRPDPPLNAKYASGILTWEPPGKDNVFTHYRIRIDNELANPIQVPHVQTMYPTAAGTTFWVSTYNDATDSESRKINT